jgi:hypothetical protein
MKLIEMLETMFFASLGITFVLILFLVYHFKQRVVSLENKCDTMFEIINSMVSEFGQVRSMINASTYTNGNSENHIREEIMMSDTNVNRENVSEYGDEDSSEDESGDDDEDSSEDESGDENSSEDESGDECSNENELVDNQQPTNTVKIINVEITGDIDAIELNYDNDNDNDNYDNNTPLEEIEVDNLVVDKIENDDDDNTLDDSSVATFSSVVKKKTDVYKKMTIPVLKSLVIEKGLISDPSKMKKQDLLTLLETNDI